MLKIDAMPTRIEQFVTAPGFDFGEFFFMDAAGDPWSVQEGDGVDAVDVAHARGEHVAFANGIGVVLAPVQCDFAARVVVELWTARPEDTLDEDADDVAELDIDLVGGLSLEAAGGGDPATVPLPPGRYRMRVSGREFDAALRWLDDEDSQAAVDAAIDAGNNPPPGPACWVLRLWRRNADTPPAALSVWQHRA